MTDAIRPVARADLRDRLRVVAVADLGLLGPDPRAAVADALEGGATMIQVRGKEASARVLFEATRLLLPLCRGAGAPLVVNDRPDVALAAGADGAHVGPDDLPPPEARRVAPALLLGVSGRTPGRLALAAEAAADYLGTGAWRATATKPDAPVPGPERLAALIAAATMPVVVIGGVLPEDAAAIRALGAAGMAVVGGIFGAADVRAAARAYRAAWDSAASDDASN